MSSGRNIIIILILGALIVLVFFVLGSFNGVVIKQLLAPVNSVTKILFVGDMSFDRYIRQVSEKRGEDFVFSCADKVLASADFVVGNLEGPITDNASVSVGSEIGSRDNYYFTFPTSTGRLLVRHNIKLVNLGNNHIGNFGIKGFASTKQNLRESGVNHFGGLKGDEEIYRTGNLSFISYNQFGGQSKNRVASTTQKEKSGGQFVIVYAHWGNEYSEDVSSIKETAKLFSENGADIIIGSHPHVVLPHEYIGKTLVYYSLGNFIFDQYWNEKVRNGLAVMIEINGEEISAKEFTVLIKRDGSTCIN